jgi:altronate dehydratase
MDLLRLAPSDNVAVAARTLTANSPVLLDGESFVPLHDIPQGHKLATRPLAAGELVIKYGQPIGVATVAIEAGQWVHSHNLSAEIARKAKSLDVPTAVPLGRNVSPDAARTFAGFRRDNGKVGTRNYVAVISNVNCSASVAQAVAARFAPAVLRSFPHVDGVIAISHETGCGIQFGGEHHRILNRTLGGTAQHPNIAAYLLVGLGCETATLGSLIDSQRLVQLNLNLPEQTTNGSPAGSQSAPRFVLSMQDQGGTQATIDEASRQLARLLPHADRARRQPVSLDNLVVATNCGGSDGNSGITANPALGLAADRLVAAGATVMLGETTEIFGAEHLLVERAASPQVARDLLDRIAWWQRHAETSGATLDNNPSPGNKAGGLTTIQEKSLGAIAKGGQTSLNAVYQYAEQVAAKGLVVMDTPGFDAVSVTGMVAGGAQVVVFTTGRGSCFGCKPAPSIKVATNTPMYRRMRGDMDINAGEILHGKSLAEVADEIFEAIVATASGKQTRSELLGYGDQEFAPWNLGPTL